MIADKFINILPINSEFLKILIGSTLTALTLFYGSLYKVAYSQNLIYSDPFLISTDTNMISTMAASALDKKDKLHIVFVGWYYEQGAPDNVTSEIFYTNNLSGEFMEPEKLPKAELPFPALFEDDFYYSKEPTIAVDSSGTVHVAYYRTEIQLDGSSWICYTNNKNGDFSVPQILYYDSHVWNSQYYSLGNNIMLAADNKSDSIHIVFDGNSGTGHGGVRYSVGVDGNFSLPVTYAKKSEHGTIKFDNEGVPNIVYWLHSDTTDTFSDVNLVWSKIVDGQFTSPEILYMGESSFSRESAFAFDQNDTIHVVFRNLDLGIFHKQMQYIKGKDGFYSTPEELPTANWNVSLMYSIEIGNNQTKYIAYKIAGDNQSLGFMYNDGSGFKDISPVDDEKYGFMSAGPQRFTLDKDNNIGYFVYTTGLIYMVTILADIIPVELASFTATLNESKVTLNWQTATETNNSGFEIQRKQDSSVWDRIDFVEGYGTTTEPRKYSYVDNINGTNSTSLSYRLKQIDFSGTYEYSDEVMVDNPAPVDYTLHQNFPNPYNPTTTITYSLPLKSKVVLVVYNTLGEEVKQLVYGVKEAGSYSVELNATGLPSSIYFYRLQAGDFIETKKMVLMK